MRLIDADILYRKLGWSARDCELAEIIEKIPTADVVEVIRCKDCKHMKYAIDKGKNGMCGVHSALIIMNENDYCSYGERREK